MYCGFCDDVKHLPPSRTHTIESDNTSKALLTSKLQPSLIHSHLRLNGIWLAHFHFRLTDLFDTSSSTNLRYDLSHFCTCSHHWCWKADHFQQSRRFSHAPPYFYHHRLMFKDFINFQFVCIWMFCLHVRLCTYMCYGMPMEARRGYQIPQNWRSYKWWWAALWVLEMKHRSSAGEAGALNHQATSLAPIDYCCAFELWVIEPHIKWFLWIWLSILKPGFLNLLWRPVVSGFSLLCGVRILHQLLIHFNLYVSVCVPTHPPGGQSSTSDVFLNCFLYFLK